MVLLVLLRERNRLDRVLVFPLGLSHPLFNGDKTFDRLAFVSYDCIFGKTFGQGLRVAPVPDGDVGRDGCGKFRNHTET